MTLNQTIIHLLTKIVKFATPTLNSYLKIDQTIQLKAYTQTLAEITSNQILLNNFDISDKLGINQKSITKPLAKNIDLLLEKIGPNITALNHLGVSYQTKNVSQEIDSIKQLINASWHLYEEKSSVKSARWFFVGDRKDWCQPLFEIVLNQANAKEQAWHPHFQIDFDINLSFQALDQLTTQFLGDSIVSYKIKYFQMFVMGEVQGVKIALGIGTSSRKPEKQRQNLFVWS